MRYSRHLHLALASGLALTAGLALAAGCGSAAAATAPEPVPALRLPSDTRPTAYQLALDIDPTQPRFRGRAVISVQLDRAREQIWLHGRDLHVSRVEVRSGNAGAAVAGVWRQASPDGIAAIALPKPVGPGLVTIEIEWDTAFHDKLVGVYRTREANLDYAFSKFEATEARWAFPCFDEPSFKTPYQVTLTVPKDDVAISNTLATGEAAVDAGHKRVQFATTKPLPSYLVAFAVGPFDVVAPPPLPPNEVRHRPLPVRGIAPHGRGGELALALAAANELLVAEERYFGIEYPYDKLDHLAVPDFVSGAMENAGAITYREELLLYTEGKSPHSQRLAIFDTTAHEMAHQWFGDLVTMHWWTDLWLNEAFATWMASRTVDEWRPREEAGVELMMGVSFAMRTDALQAARKIRQPVRAHADIRDQFDGLTYQKGAAVLGMFERWLGAEVFRTGISQYLRAHAFGSGSTEDLLRTLSEVGKRDVTTPFMTFLEQPGVPLIEASLSCDGAPALALRQSRYLPLGSKADAKQQWQIPVCARYGSGAEAHESCTLLTEPSGKLPLTGRCPSWVVPNAHGAGYFRWTLGARELASLGRNWARLDVRERLSTVQNLAAATESGALPVADALRALEPAARDANGLVALVSLQTAERVRSTLVAPAERPRVAAYMGTLYRPVLARLGWTPRADEPAATRELRATIIRLLALNARDPEVRRQALTRGRAVFDVAHATLRGDGIDADLLPAVVGAVVQEDGARALDALVTVIDHTTDAGVRRALFVALSASDDMNRLGEVVLSEHVRRGERRIFLGTIGQRADRLDVYFDWMKQHVDAMIASMPEQASIYVPSSLRGLCDVARAEEMAALFTARLSKLPAMRRNIAETEEAIRLCAAYRDKQLPSASAFFSKPGRAQAPRSGAAQ